MIKDWIIDSKVLVIRRIKSRTIIIYSFPTKGHV
jgi:hypothetical protein